MTLPLTPRFMPLLAWAAVMFPWLWPWASPPSPSTPGLLAAWGLTALLWVALKRSTPDASQSLSLRALVVLGALLVLAAWRMPVLDLALLGGLAGSVLCILVAARCVPHVLISWPRYLCWGLLTASLISVAIAGLQYSGLLHQPHAWLSWLHASPQEEAYGQLRQRNQFGSLMSLGLAAWCYLAHTGWPTREQRAMAWVCLLTLTLGQVASTSRTGALTWMGLSLLILLGSRRNKVQDPPARSSGPGARSGAAWALIGIVVLSWVLPAVVSSFATVELPKMNAFERLAVQAEGLGICESRVVLWRHVLELSWAQPWLGWGWGELDFVHATQPVLGPRFCGQLGHAHNLLLQVVVEWGWPLALGGLCGLLLWVRRHTPWEARNPAALLGWSWAGVIGVHSLLEFPLWYGPFQMVLGLALGLIARPSATAHAPRHAAPRQTVTAGVIALWLACTVWAGWDYHRVSQVFQPASVRSSGCRVNPEACLSDVVWFHQARDFALLRLGADAMPALEARQLAQRVAHFAPEPWILALLHPPSPTPTPPPNR